MLAPRTIGSWARLERLESRGRPSLRNLMTYDIAVIGGGIVGLSFAMQVGRAVSSFAGCGARKGTVVARHQTGHNSGVIHSGVYYKAGSLKATAVRRGGAGDGGVLLTSMVFRMKCAEN